MQTLRKFDKNMRTEDTNYFYAFAFLSYAFNNYYAIYKMNYKLSNTQVASEESKDAYFKLSLQWNSEEGYQKFFRQNLNFSKTIFESMLEYRNHE